MKLKNILQNTNYWYKNAFETDHARKPVFFEVLNTFNNQPINILEIGAIGGDMSDTNYIYGAGGSSFYFAEYVRQNGGSLTIVDVNSQILGNAKIMLEDFITTEVDIRFICQDGIEYLKQNREFDLVYLDAGDEECQTYEMFRLINRIKSRILCDDANGWERGAGKCVRIRKYYTDYQLYKCGVSHEMIFYDTIKKNDDKFKTRSLELNYLITHSPLPNIKNMKFWLTFITQNRFSDIKEMTEDLSPFDGIIAVDHLSDDGTYELLENRKKDGKIIQRPFVNHHAHSMNEFLFSGAMKNGDYFLILDSSDRINPVWLKRIREDIGYLNKNDVGAVFLDRIFLVRYLDSMEFFGAVHWGLKPIWGRSINYSQINGYRKENWIINKRGDNSILWNPSKYYWEYGHGSSHTELLYRQFGDDIWAKHENIRMQFRINCQYLLGLEFTLDSLIKYMKENLGKYPEWFEQILETEVSVKDIFRFKVLNQPLPVLCSNRFDWSYFKWKETGLVDQLSDGEYIGIFNIYRLQQGKNRE